MFYGWKLFCTRARTFPSRRSSHLGQGRLPMAGLPFSPVVRHPLRNRPQSLPGGTGPLVLQGGGHGMCLPRRPPWPLPVPSAEAQLRPQTCPLRELCRAWWELPPGL